MKAVAYYQSLPIDNYLALQDIDLPVPTAQSRDLIVRVNAISVNPVDYKIRKSSIPAEGQTKVLGWDAVGIVESIGSAVTKFNIGDRVYYAGSLIRPGANSELHAVDERIVALAPKSLNDAEAAALPLTTITAYELLFDRLGVTKNGGEGQTILIIGGAGGVGSILIQLARQLTKLRIVTTASRAETRQWCLNLGAHLVIDHSKSLPSQLKDHDIEGVDFVAGLTQTPQHFSDILESLKPQGRLGVIDSMAGIDITALMTKSISVHWELMFTRSMFETADMDEQGKLLAEVATLVDAGKIHSTANNNFGVINAENLWRAHAFIESGKAQGKVVLQGFNQ